MPPFGSGGNQNLKFTGQRPGHPGYVVPQSPLAFGDHWWPNHPVTPAPMIVDGDRQEDGPSPQRKGGWTCGEHRDLTEELHLNPGSANVPVARETQRPVFPEHGNGLDPGAWAQPHHLHPE